MKAKRYWNSVVRTVFPKLALTDFGDPRQYIGKRVLAVKELGAPEEDIVITHIQGAAGAGATHLQKYFVINGTHFVHMYSFFTQMLEGRAPTKEEMDEFELASQIKDIKEVKDGQTQKK